MSMKYSIPLHLKHWQNQICPFPLIQNENLQLENLPHIGDVDNIREEFENYLGLKSSSPGKHVMRTSG